MIALIFVAFNIHLQSRFKVTSVLDIIATNSYSCALALQLTVYVLTVMLFLTKDLDFMNSETIIRYKHRQLLIRLYIKSFKNCFLFLVILYMVANGFVIYHFGWSFYMGSPVFLLSCAMIALLLPYYAIVMNVFLLIYLLTNQKITSLIITAATSTLLSSFISKHIYISLFELAYMHVSINIMSVLSSFFISALIFYLTFLCVKIVLYRKDFVYDDEEV